MIHDDDRIDDPEFDAYFERSFGPKPQAPLAAPLSEEDAAYERYFDRFFPARPEG